MVSVVCGHWTALGGIENYSPSADSTGCDAIGYEGE